jgi:hypothetical protein
MKKEELATQLTELKPLILYWSRVASTLNKAEREAIATSMCGVLNKVANEINKLEV